jgi:hypothetical protein
LSFFLLSLATSMRFCYVFPLADTNKILDQTIVTFRQSLTECDLLYKVLESVKGLIGFSSFPLLHIHFESICHFQKEPALWTTRSLSSVDIKTTRRSGVPILNGPGTSES